MILDFGRIGKIRPDVVRRRCTGWLAVTPETSPFSIGMTAPAEQEARENFSFMFMFLL